MAMKYKDENGNWTTGQRALTTEILDLEGNFESDNVEGALRELANKTPSGIDNLKSQVTSNTSNIGSIKNTLQNMQDEIDYLRENGGGGGGSALPSIKSDFVDCAIEKGTDVVIPIFFSSPNMGNGTAYILVNNIEVDTSGVSQGNNNIRVKAQYLTNTENKIGIYVKDRAGIVSNQLSWTVIAGGIELTSSFDYEVDYGITDPIKLTYNIDTGITGSDIVMYLTIDGNTTEYPSVNGYNSIDIDPTTLGLGTHSVTMYATVDKYTSRTLSFNLVIVSTDTLYLSSTFVNGSTYKYGVPISINYRLSKVTTEEYKVFIKVDGSVVKTQTIPVGSYYWTATNLSVGPHTITIQAVSQDYSEEVSIDLTLTIEQGEYDPMEDYTLGLLLDLNAVGKSNTDSTVMDEHIWNDDSGNGHHGKLINFNYGTNGFIDDTLICDNDAYVEIEWSPWALNATSGSTIDLIYQPINSGIEECRVIDYTEITDDLSTDEIKPFKGLFADIRQAITSSASSGTSAGKVNLEDDVDEVHLTWVLDRVNKFMKVYIDGVLSRIMFLSDSGSGTSTKYEDFSLDSNIYLNSTKGENCGTYNIKRLRVYDHALTSDKVLQNHLANIKDLEKQQELYTFNYENNTLPKMFLTGDITNMTPTQTVDMKIEYISPNEEKFGASFNTGIQNNPVKIQGTSSLQYVRHNYTIYLKDEYGSDMYYNPYGAGSVADYVFCLKADYVESSHANNTGMAKFINNCVYDTKTPAQLDNENCRTTINGFPIELYMNGEYLGVYNFNHDRYSYQSYGYDYKKYPNLLVYEINSNSNTSAGAFYRYGDNPESSANVTELEYYKRDFNLIYGNRTTDSDTYSEIKTLVEWVSVAEQDLFRETISEHFNTEYLFRYFLTVLMIGAVDSLGKNMKITTYDGKVWYPTFYDLDTILGIDNTGYLTIEPDVEIESGSYNTSNSNLWTKVWNFFRQELKEEWAKMRQGNFTLNNLMSYIYGEQISKIPAKLYNEDAEVKYLQFGSLYTYCCHGSKEHLIKRWLKERIAYVDSMLDYFTSQDDQITVRMNKTGYVSFEVTPYIPLYFSVKWSNASGGTQTFKLKRGETKTFYYTSTTSTDQEVIIYHAQYVKRLDNLSNLNPSSCILANAKKLTNVEIHSPELYNINVTGNTFLRNIDLRDCTALGTVTATGSSLDVSNCKYLRYVDIYNTNLTEVQLNTSGGSLLEIYYPKSIQSVTLIKQSLLKVVGLPYNYGEEIPTSLYNIDIENCPVIEKLNTSDDPNIYKSFASMIYCNNLTLRNTLDLQELNFDGFYRLRNVKIENMYNLETVGFNNLLPVGQSTTMKYIGMSNCPKLETIEMNCDSNDYEISFADKAILNFGGLTALKSIQSNCVLKGLQTIVLPLNIESMYFTNEYGTGYSSIENMWSSSVCSVNTEGSTATVTHVIEGFKGMDLAGINGLKNIDLGALVNISQAINFKMAPTTVNPHFNINRDGVEYPYLQPIGTLDLSNYTESLAKFFDGVDLTKLQLVCNNKLPQTDLSYCFYNSTFTKDSQIAPILSNLDTVNNMEYCFYKTSVKDVSILNTINFLAGTSLAYCFADCPNISKLENITLSGNIGNASYMFSGSGVSTIKNVSTSCGNIVGMFSRCNNLVTVTNFDANGTTSYESLFEGCSGMSVAPVTEIPATITNIKNMYKDCDGLVSIDGFVLHGNITEATGFIQGCDNLINANNVTISGPFYNDIFRGLTSLKYVNNLLINYVGRSMTFANMFDGCRNLLEMSFHDDSYVKDVISMDYMFRGTSMKTVDFSNVNFEKIVSYKYMFADCLMEEFSFTVPKTITSIQGMLSNCINLKTLKNFNILGNVTVTDWILDTPIENLINCSFYNQNTTFKDNTTLKKIEGFNYTGTNLANYFEGCSNLQSAELTVGNTVTKINNLFASCPLLTTVEFNSESDLSGVTTISDMFNGDSSLTTIRNLKITNSSTIANNTTLKDCPINNTDGFYINSNSAVQMFRMGAESKITQFTDFEMGTSCDNLSEAFKDYPLLIKDIYLPSHMANVSYAFSNCISMINIVSNWTNYYERNDDDDLNNDVITEGCYEGSDNIKYIDGELYMNEYGELTAMQYIPQEWGGSASYEDNQTAFDVKITEDNLVYSMLGNVGDHKTNWGDGTEDMNISHGYSKAGTYTIITENVETFAQGTVVDTAISSPIVKFRALNKSQTNGSHLFDGWSNLLKVNKLNNTFNSYDYMFNDCAKLADVDLSECTLSQTVTTMKNMCQGCKTFTKTPIYVIPDTCKNINGLFYNCTNLKDISGMTFGSGITDAGNWFGTGYYTAPITTANNVTIKNNVVKFNGCNTLISCDNFTFTGTLMNWMFNNCGNLQSVKNFTTNNKVTNYTGLFGNCGSLGEVDFINIDLTSATTINYMIQGLKNGAIIKNIRFGSNITSTGMDSWMNGALKNIENVYIPTNIVAQNFKGSNDLGKILNSITGVTFSTDVTDITGMLTGATQITEDFLIPSHITNCTETFKGCTSMTHVHSNWNNTYTNGITSTDCYSGCTGITHIDGENVIAFEGDCGLDYITTDWGGNGFTSDITGIYKMEIDNDSYEAKFENSYAFIDSAYLINWGDGNITTGTTSHTYDSSGIYYVKMKGYPGAGGNSCYFVRDCLVEVIQLPNKKATIDLAGMIQNCNKLTKITFPLNWNYNYGRISGMLQGDGNLKEIVNFETINFGSNVVNINSMFRGCSSLTSSVLSVAFQSILKMKGLKDINSLFYGCSSLTNMDFIKNLDTSSVTNMNNMFYGCSSLTQIDLSSWNTSSAINISGLFNGCKNLKEIKGINDLDVSQVTNMYAVFGECKNLTSLDLSNWDVGNVQNMSWMFSGCENLVNVDFITNWNMNNVTSINGMFSSCKKLTEVNFNPDMYMANYGTTLANTFNETYELTRISGLKLNPEKLYSSQNSILGFIGKAHKIRYIENMYLGGSNANSYNIFMYNTRGAIPDSSVTFIWDENSIFKGFDVSINSSISIGYETLLRICTPESRQSFAENVYDRISNGLDAVVVNNLGSAYLNEEQVALITSKGYTLVN